MRFCTVCSLLFIDTPAKGGSAHLRIDYARVAPEALETMYGLEKYVRQIGLEPSLLELIKLRASQINGCAFCVDMNTKDARARGEGE